MKKLFLILTFLSVSLETNSKIITFNNNTRFKNLSGAFSTDISEFYTYFKINGPSTSIQIPDNISELAIFYPEQPPKECVHTNGVALTYNNEDILDINEIKEDCDSSRCLLCKLTIT